MATIEERYTSRPKALRDKIFDRLFMEAEIAAFTPEELREYEGSHRKYRHPMTNSE